MINIFPINLAGDISGLKLSGNTNQTGTDSNAANSLFGLLLQNISNSSENASEPMGLFSGTTLTDMTANPGSTNSNTANALIGKKTAKSSIEASDLTLSETAVPQLVSFLQSKGFSTDQIDKMILSSRNEKGLVMIDKLVTAMDAAGKAAPSNIPDASSTTTGLIIGTESIPRVQEMLFKMGLGVGEVKATIEKSVDPQGSISLDKLTNTLKGIFHGNISKAELVSQLNQNNVSVNAQSPDATASTAPALHNVAVINAQSPDVTASTAPALHNVAVINAQSPDVTASTAPALHNVAIINAQSPDVTASTAPALHNVAAIDAQTPSANSAAADFKKEFMNFIQGSSRNLKEKEVATAAVKANVVQFHEIKSRNETITGADVKATDLSKTATQTATQDSNLLNQVMPKDRTKIQKGDQAKIINILNSEDKSNAVVGDKGLSQQKIETIHGLGETIRQGDQKVKQDLVSNVAANNTVPETQTSSLDLKGSVLDMRDTQIIDLNSQNISKISGNIETRTQTKGVYTLPDPLPKVVDHMVLMVKNGEQTGRIIIQPPELGKLDIDLTLKNGHITANLTTETFAVKEIIESNLNQLKQQLTDQGLIVEQFNVSVGSQHKQFRDDNNQAWNNGKESSGSGASGIEDVSAITSEMPASGMTGGRYKIDVRV